MSEREFKEMTLLVIGVMIGLFTDFWLLRILGTLIVLYFAVTSISEVLTYKPSTERRYKRQNIKRRTIKSYKNR